MDCSRQLPNVFEAAFFEDYIESSRAPGGAPPQASAPEVVVDDIESRTASSRRHPSATAQRAGFSFAQFLSFLRDEVEVAASESIS